MKEQSPIIKVLMVHGSRQSGELFRAKSQAMQKLIRQALAPQQPGSVEFHYPTAPFALELSGPSSKLRDQHGQWAWWQSELIDGIYPGLETGLETLASVLKDEGPFDGVIGFSQGAAIAAMVASLLEGKRKDAFSESETGGGSAYPAVFSTLDHPPLKFVISMSGYAASHQDYRAFYHPRICTPTLHILGSLDTVVEEHVSMKLVESCQGEEDGIAPLIVHHPGGHVIPSGKRELMRFCLGNWTVVNSIIEVWQREDALRTTSGMDLGLAAVDWRDVNRDLGVDILLVRS